MLLLLHLFCQILCKSQPQCHMSIMPASMTNTLILRNKLLLHRHSVDIHTFCHSQRIHIKPKSLRLSFPLCIQNCHNSGTMIHPRYPCCHFIFRYSLFYCQLHRPLLPESCFLLRWRIHTFLILQNLPANKNLKTSLLQMLRNKNRCKKSQPARFRIFMK